MLKLNNEYQIEGHTFDTPVGISFQLVVKIYLLQLNKPPPLTQRDDYESLVQYWLKVYNAGGEGSMKKWNEALAILGGEK